MRAKKLADLRALEAERLSKELERRADAAEKRAIQSESVFAQLHNRTLQLEYVQSQLEQTQAELAHTLADLNQVQSELGRTHSDLNQVQFKLSEVKADLEGQLAAIKQSWSWRLTKPMRYIYYRYFHKFKAVSELNSDSESGLEPAFDQPIITSASVSDLNCTLGRVADAIVADETTASSTEFNVELSKDSSVLEVPLNGIDPKKPNLLIVYANTESSSCVEQLLSYLPSWQTQYNLFVLILDHESVVSRWQKLAVNCIVAPAAKGSYDETEKLVLQINHEQSIDVALIYGLEGKTILPTLANLNIATLTFIEETLASISSRFAYQEVFFGTTLTILENNHVEYLCQQAYPQLNLDRVQVLSEVGANLAQTWLEHINQTRIYHHLDEADAKILTHNPKFDLAFLGLDPEQRFSRLQLAYLYIRSWKAHIERRKPYPGFHPAIYAESQLDTTDQSDPFSHYLRHDQPDGPWNYPVITLEKDTSFIFDSRIQSVALHIHVYYPDMLPALLERLIYNTVRPDLFVSVKSASDIEIVEEVLKHYSGTVVAIKVVPNVGRDIGPFLTEFGTQLVQDYEIIGHLHTKKSLHVTDRHAVESWQSFLLSCLLGDGHNYAMADKILAAMQAQPELGVVFPDDPKILGWDRNRVFADVLAPELEISTLPNNFNFPAGNMFWIRSEVLARFVALDLQWDDYPLEPIGKDATMLHAIERLFGVVPEAMGLRCGVSALNGVTRP